MIDAAVADVERLLADGEYLRAYDRASLLAVPDDPSDAMRIRFLRALALARTGAVGRAAAELDNLDPLAPGINPSLAEDIAVNAGRLAKMRALRNEGTLRVEALRQAADLYESVARRFEAASYAAINAATLRLLAGQEAHALEMASLAEDALAPGSEGYWACATRAEIALIRGDIEAARSELDRARASLATTDHFRLEASGSRATTRRQLRLICEHLGVDAEHVLGPIANGDVLHFCGSMRIQQDIRPEVERALQSMQLSEAYGSLAAGADIEIATALLDGGVPLHLVLPFSVEDFVEQSVRPAGSDWLARFEECLSAASSVQIASDSRHLGDDVLFGYASDIAMGRTLTRARELDARARQLAVWDGVQTGLVAGTARDVGAWRSLGLDQHVVRLSPAEHPIGGASTVRRSRSVRAFLFGDFSGFSKMTDEQYQLYAAYLLGPIGDTLHRHREHVLDQNSWGDAVHVIVDGVSAAAEVALELQERLAQVDLEAVGLPARMRLRLSAHVGPVWESHDPVRGRRVAMGRELTRAARIEPRTPPGEVYCSQAFAALLELEPTSRVSPEYVGQVTTAKDFETVPIYLLRRPLGS